MTISIVANNITKNMHTAPQENEEEEETVISSEIVLFSLVLSFVLILSKYLRRNERLSSLLPEAGMVLLVGIIFGGIIEVLLNNDNAPESSATSLESSIIDDNNNNVNSTISIIDNTNQDIIQEETEFQIEEEVVTKGLLSFSDEIFFLFLLPPIIFHSGYKLRSDIFFQHIQPILLLAVIGTIISTISIAIFLYMILDDKFFPSTSDSDSSTTFKFNPTFTELLTFGALISATDPVSTLAVFEAKRVDSQLFYLVFGESVLNDAVGLVLFNAFSKFVLVMAPSSSSSGTEGEGEEIVIDITEFVIGFIYDSICSPILGIFCGIVAALIFKYVDLRAPNVQLVELCLILQLMYIPFLIAEMLDLSGIVTILFTGLSTKSYVIPNISHETKHNCDTIFELIAHLAEICIFLELGLSTFAVCLKDGSSVQGTFILWSLMACLIGRALNVYPLVFIHNYCCCCCPGSRSSFNTTTALRDGNEADEAGHTTVPRNDDNNDSLGNVDGHYHDDTTKVIEMSNIKSRRRREGEVNGGEYDDDGDGGSYSSAQENDDADDDGDHLATASTKMGRRSNKPNAAATSTRISSNTAHMVWFSGLRGAVAYACVRSFPATFHHNDEFTVTTMIIVLITVFGLGSTTEAMLHCLQIEMNVTDDDEDDDNDNNTDRRLRYNIDDEEDGNSWYDINGQQRRRNRYGWIWRLEGLVQRYTTHGPEIGMEPIPVETTDRGNYDDDFDIDHDDDDTQDVALSAETATSASMPSASNATLEQEEGLDEIRIDGGLTNETYAHALELKEIT